MSSRSEARAAAPSWGRAIRAEPVARVRTIEPAHSPPRVRWGIRAPARSDAVGAAVLAATAGLWIAVLLAAW